MIKFPLHNNVLFFGDAPGLPRRWVDLEQVIRAADGAMTGPYMQGLGAYGEHQVRQRLHRNRPGEIVAECRITLMVGETARQAANSGQAAYFALVDPDSVRAMAQEIIRLRAQCASGTGGPAIALRQLEDPAVLEGAQTQLRRVIDPHPQVDEAGYLMGEWLSKPFGGLLMPKATDLPMEAPWRAGDRLCGQEVAGVRVERDADKWVWVIELKRSGA